LPLFDGELYPFAAELLEVFYILELHGGNFHPRYHSGNAIGRSYVR
jgi:hypothetical protein